MLSRYTRIVGLSLIKAILFLVGVALDSSAAQYIPTTPQPAGILRVIVTDAQQRLLRGAICSLRRANVSTAAVANATTDDQGVAVLTAISPGSYVLRVTCKGFETFIKDDVIVEDEQSSDINVVLRVAPVAESVTVESPSETATKVEAGASTPTGSIEPQALKRLPLATSRIDEALPLIPGVVRSSAGEISIKGASEQQSALLVNGLNAADPASGNFRLNLPIDSVEAVQVFQHPYTAEYGQFTGGVTRIETRRGGDQWHWELNDFFPDFRFKGGHVVGIAEDLPRLNFNGPLIKNRLFLSQSLSYSIAKTPVRGLLFPVNETKTESQNYFSQVDLLLSSHHTQTFTFGYFPERQQFVGLDLFRPQPVTPNYNQRDFVFAARDNYDFESGLLQSSISFKRFNANVWGQGLLDQTLMPSVEAGNYFATQARRSIRTEILEVYQLPTQKFWGGSHEFKVGFDFNSVSNRLRYTARPVNIVRGDGTLAERITFDPPRRIRGENREYVSFVQDRWLVMPNLSFDLGLRYENQRIAEEQNLAPRAGFAWSPFLNDRTVIRGGIGIFHDKVPLNIRSFNHYPARTVTRYGRDGLTIVGSRHLTNILVETAPITPLDFRFSNTEAGFVPRNVTWNIQLDQIVNRSVTLRANLVGSRTTNIYIVNPELDFRGQSAIVLRSAGRADYRSLELSARFALPEKNELHVSYVRSRARGDLNDFNSSFGDFGQPVIRQNQFSNLPFDVPHRFIAWGTVALPNRITLAPIIEARSGFPFSVRDAEQNFVGVRNSNQTRFPPFFAIDTDISKEIQVTKKYGLRLSLQIFNLTDHFNPRNVRANTGDPAFLQFSSSYRRYFTGGFDILF
jgi:Carboxypeptidase regulatory-like domain/TonB-dependent Receptor Plug Domain/TonB dependent receptor-like, beta-barrel